ncbi:uncharacterized protein CEXT_395301 [Caerostris extrusa]|uniref:Uncharacterized protein n=1 Tax=Caerostris extrusa TaxID=172846 RepID=A0AAV4MVZ4_CAEEX|nr:uncharacterized protein CEXT_395301 [Caerostris extrusa]
MDHHKQNMIQRWIEEHSQQIQNAAKMKNEVWIDYPSNSKEKGSSGETQKGAAEASNAVLGKDDKSSPKVKRSTKHGATVPKTEMTRTTSSIDINLLPQQEEEENFDEADSASNSADVDETDNEENAEASGYDSDLHILQISQSGSQTQSLHQSISENTFQATLPDEYEETIEVFEPEEPVPMVDSCLQVTEEDILAEYWMQRRHKSSENPLPEVDQSSCGSNEHPLRILSEEDLNLPSSFTDSRSVSVDLDSISVPDIREGLKDRGAVTWRLLYGNMFQRIKEQQQKQRRTADDLATVTNSEINDKLERIAKLRDLIQPLTRHRSQTKVESIFKTCPVRSGSRYTMPEILGGSRDSSMEDLSAAEVTSTQSEPADLDLDKYDYKLNIKPMNGLKLEAFYKKIQKVPPFLEQYSTLKPTQVVPPLSYEQENLYLVNKLESQRSESTTFISNSGYKQFSNSTYLRTSLEGTDERDHIQSAYCLTQTNSSTLLHKPPSTSNLQRESAKFSSSENTIPTKISRTTTDLGSELERRSTEKRDHKKSLDNNDSTKRGESKQNSKTSSNKTIDTSMLTVGQSPSISSKSRLHRGKIKNGEGQNVHSQQLLAQSSSSSLWSKDSSISSSTSKVPHRSGVHPNGSTRSPNNKSHVSNGIVPNGSSSKTSRTINNNACKLPTRSSPTSSSTSGVTTMCCAGTKSKDKTLSSKSKPFPSHSKQKQSTQDSRKSQRTKSMCRSTSSPSTCVDSGDTAITDFTDSEHYHGVRHASVSGALASPYHKVPHVHVSHHHHHHHHQRTSSGHGSESSVNSSEPREAKELLLKGAKTQQFSGTSSGYESMLRDSEGTPLSSSQESGNEDSMEKGERGRKGRRRSNGSSKRSSSAPARSPPSPLGPAAATAINQQPLPSRRRGDRTLHRSDEEVCCTSLLCCRLLDFY